MPMTVDDLRIEINTQAVKANDAIDKLDDKLNTLQQSLGRLDASKLASFGNAVNRLSHGMKTLKDSNVQMPDFSRLAKGIDKIASVDAATIGRAASSIHRMTNALGNLKNVEVGPVSRQVAELAKGISQLGYKSATQAIDNIPKLAQGMSQMMKTLSKAPRVSKNLIDMTNALAKLARTGSSSGRAATALGKSLDSYTASTGRARRGTFSLAGALGKLYASYWLIFRAFGKLGESINLASSLTEVENVVNTTFGEYASLVDKMADTSIADFGMSELTTKKVASRFQAMGTAMGFTQGKMADMSIELTKLTADMASFYNVEQDAVAEDLASIFTGETRPLRDYGLDLTQATLAEWAMTQGLNANIQSMSQAEKAMLRYQYVLANTGAAQGDFARTAHTWANQVRILKQNFEALGIVVGKTLINALRPLITALNNAMGHIIAFAETVSNALGKIFGWKFEVTKGGGMVDEMAGAADYSDDLASGMGTAADNAKKLKTHLLGIDELNVVQPDDDSASGIGGGGLGNLGGAGGAGTGDGWTKTETIWKDFESEIDSLYELGEYIGNALIAAMQSIDWDAVYEKARNFGRGLAEFLNGLISPELFGEVGKTIANSLNAAIYAVLEFGKTFDFYEFGQSIATGINEFFNNFDFVALGQTINVWTDGIKDTIKGFLDTLTWESILGGAIDFLGELKIDTITFWIGAFALKQSTAELLSMARGALFSKISFLTNPINIPTLLLTFGKFAIQFNPGMIGELGQQIEQMLIGTIFDTSTWTGLAKKIDEAITGIIDFVFGDVLGSIAGTIGDFLAGIFNWDVTLAVWDQAKTDFIEAFNGEDIGKNILAGVGQGLVAGIGLVIEPLADFFKQFYEAICAVFGIHSPATTMEPIGKNIMLGIVQGFTGTISEFTNAISNWFTTSVAPWFTAEKWYEVANGIQEGFNTKWAEIVAWWQETAIYTWWENDVKPWFTVEKWATELENIKKAFTNKWGETAKQWREKLLQWWETDVKPWFTLNRWMTLLKSIADSFRDSFQKAREWVEEKVQKMYDFVSDIVGKITSLIDSIGQAISGVIESAKSIGSSIGANLGISVNATGFASGGFPERSSLFFAGEHGIPEILGTVGGRTAVAGGDEITGIRQAVYDTGSAETALMETMISLLQVIAEKETSFEVDGRELLSAVNDRQNRSGFSFA